MNIYIDQTRDLLSVPVFNPERFESVTLGDATLQHMLLTSFLREVPELDEALHEATFAGVQPFADTVHRLRSSVHFVAGERLAKLLVRVEAIGTRGSTPQLRARACECIARELKALRGILVRVNESLPAPHVQASRH